MQLPINTLLQGGKYKIIRFINSGGFGCTYEAEHLMLEKRVAIKEFFVKDYCNRDDVTRHVTVGTQSKKALVTKMKKKFVDEAKALCRMQHPGIVKVTDVFEENGTAYFVMDYIDGRSLSEIVKKSPLTEQRALDYIRQVSSALQYVHSNNRLHLDIKPANIMITAQGKSVLIDFGASKQYDEENGENTSTLMGKTPGYAPPEQMYNDVSRFTPATDIYALGATLYKMLTGITPPAANLLISGDTLQPLPKNISEGVRKAIDAAMNMNKMQRPQSVADFMGIMDGEEQEETELVADVVEPENPPAKKSKSKTKYMLLFLALFIGWLLWPEDTQEVSQSQEVVRHEVKGLNYTNTLGTAFVYSGFVNSANVPDSTGVGKYKDGTYKGMYRDGIRNGKGTFDTADGSNHFTGTFKDDMYHEGRMTFNDKTYYEGTFKNNEFDTGKWYNADGTLDSEMRNGEYVTK
ncbi:MAG: protein kinase [Prevotella sp.]|nr:protein kinase [Prevotella sp.]